jgi:hypothetical protein
MVVFFIECYPHYCVFFQTLTLGVDLLDALLLAGQEQVDGFVLRIL